MIQTLPRPNLKNSEALTALHRPRRQPTNMSQIQHDLEAVARELGDALLDQFNGVIEGGIEDLEGPVREIASRMAVAARRKNQDLMDACRDQLALVVQEKEIQVKAAKSGVMDFILERGVTLLVNGAIAGLSGLRVTP